MKEKGNSKNLIIVVAILAVVFAAGYFYATRDQSSDDLLQSTMSATEASVDSDLISALKDLQKLNLDSSVFSHPVWLSLTDFGKVLEPQNAGRPNPFAPLNQNAALGQVAKPQ